jgi:colanic acid biosynthesis glycosyl transferase WcaI
MQIWFLNQFYPPDRAPTGAMLQVVARRLSGEGNRCVVWCSGGAYGVSGSGEGVPNGAELVSDGVSVVRIGKLGAGKSFVAKLWGWLGFYLGLSLRLLTSRERPDVIVALTTPPFLSVLARVAAWRHGARHAHWVMDLYPDVLAAHGMLKEEHPLYRALAALSRWGMSGPRAGAVLTLGPCMADRVEVLLGSNRKNGTGGQAGDEAVRLPGLEQSGSSSFGSVRWVPLWASAADDGAMAGERLRVERGWGADEVVILYSGNLGRGHVVAPTLEAALELSREGLQNLRWVFCAHGARLEEVRRFAAAHPHVRIDFLEPVATELLAAHLASADVHLASLEDSWSGCMVPSKIQGSFAAGRAVCFIGPRQSSPARWIEESGGGWAMEASEAVTKFREILAAADLKEESKRRGAAAKVYALRYFDREINAGEVAKILISG